MGIGFVEAQAVERRWQEEGEFLHLGLEVERDSKMVRPGRSSGDQADCAAFEDPPFQGRDLPAGIGQHGVPGFQADARGVVCSTGGADDSNPDRSEEHTSELPSLMRLSSAVFCLKKKKTITKK